MRRCIPALIFILLAISFLWKSTIGGRVLLPGDYLAQMRPWSSVSISDSSHRQWDPIQWDALAEFYPWRVFYSRMIHQGSLPLWNPYQFCGTPFAANGQSAVFYPLNLIHVLISPDNALGWSAALHLFLAGLFTFLLIRNLGVGRFGAYIGGVTFAFGAFMVTWLELPTLVNVATWLPLALLLIHIAVDSGKPAPAVGAGIALALALLAGHLQVAMYVFAMSFIWLVWLVARQMAKGNKPNRKIFLGLLIFAIAILVAAPQILPTLELSGMSHRVREASSQGLISFQANAIPIRNVVTAFLPDFYGNPSKGSYWGGIPFAEYALYVGIFPLMLAIVGVVCGRKRGNHTPFFAIAAVLSLLSAFGSPLNALFYYTVPGFPALGGPNRIIVLYTLAMAVLAGIGADWLAQTLTSREEISESDQQNTSSTRPVIIAVLLTIVLFAVALITSLVSLSKLPGIDLPPLLVQTKPQLVLLATFISIGSLIIVLRLKALISRQLFMGLGLAIVLADLASFGYAYNPTCDRSAVLPDNPVLKDLQQLSRGERIMPLNSKWSLYDTPAGTILPPNTAMLYGIYDVQGYDSLFTRRYKDFSTRIQSEDSSPPENGNMVFFKRYSKRAAMLARYIVSSEPINDPQLLLIRTDELYVYKNPSALPFAFVKNGKVKIENREANTIQLEVLARQPSKLVITQQNYPGWHAKVDGFTEHIHPYDDVFQSVNIPAGWHKVTLSFEPQSVRNGYMLAAIGLMLAAACLVLQLPEKKK